jgi:hypothetical protein
MHVCHGLLARRSILVVAAAMMFCHFGPEQPALAQTVSGVRSFDGGVAPLFTLVGPGNLYVDKQGTQGYIYNFGNNFESYNFNNPTTGQAWSGALMTLGPQLSIGLIQGANQAGSGFILPSPPRQPPPLLDIQSTILDDIP